MRSPGATGRRTPVAAGLAAARPGRVFPATVLFVALCLAVIAGNTQAQAQTQPLPAEAGSTVAAPRLLGQARFTWLGIHIYDAALWSSAARFDWAAPMALQLTYAMGIDGDDLLDTSMDEIARVEGPSADLPQLKQQLARCMGTVDSGDRYVAASDGDDHLRMWLNGRQTCDVSHPGIKRRFLGIWLGDDTRSPRLSRRLRGG
ncbi:chalcone isomerase family protein [Pseudooceanicola sediminis]|nr:chalcone isomerase family protein [Pseudooceanicola sediminis]|tara:strand:+ start:10361 stop:10969 length:609 start_codon:yes stop_codon:yes gene_type:complete